MSRTKFEFKNADGLILAGLLETPEGVADIEHFAVFAHCFTCGKDIAAASRIARALAKKGIAVLRFDFTGLGNSDGDFANTNFSSNVADLVAAAEALKEHHLPPTLLIGHSLGGAAVLQAAQFIPSLKAVVTLAAPATAEHVKHLFCAVESDIEEKGEATVAIGAREFNIKKQLVDDLDQHNNTEHIHNLGLPLLVFHSPIDKIVGISEAGKIYQAAMHPKSFISLDHADHLLSNKDDAEYVATTLSAWASRYLKSDDHEAEPAIRTSQKLEAGVVRISELDKAFQRGLFTDSHQLKADEPLSFGGSNLGPTPYDLLLMSLGACTSMTLRMYANHKKWPLEDVLIDLQHERIHATDCADCEQTDGKIDRILRTITLVGDELDESQLIRLMEVADRCPVHRTLENNPVVISEMA